MIWKDGTTYDDLAVIWECEETPEEVMIDIETIKKEAGYEEENDRWRSCSQSA